MSRVLMSLTALVGLGLVASVVVAQTESSRMRAFRGEGQGQTAQMAVPEPPAAVRSHVKSQAVEQLPGVQAVCAHCGKPFVYRPVVKSLFVREGAPEPKSPPASYEGPDPMYDVPDPATLDRRPLRNGARNGISKPLPFRDGPQGHLSRYAKTWDEEQMLCDECLAALRGKLAGRTMFSAAPTHPGMFGFGVAGGVRTIFQRGPEGERFYGAKTFFDEAEDPPYWPRQYKVEPIYSVPNGNVQTYVRPYQFPNSKHKGNVVTVPAL